MWWWFRILRRILGTVMEDGAANTRRLSQAWHPWLLGVVPALLALPGGDASALGVCIALAAGLSCAAVFVWVGRLWTRDRTRAALGTSALLAATFLYGPGYDLAAKLNRTFRVEALIGQFDFVRHRHVLPVWLLAWGGVSLLFVLSRRDCRRWTPVVNVVALTLVIVAAARAGWPAAATRSAPTSEQHASAPDIYHLVLDRYPRGDVLRSSYGFDNTPFLRWLRARGFHVADSAQCNYASTTLSVWSTLNMRYFPDVVHRAEAMRSIQDGHAVADFVRTRGYRYIHLGSHHGPLTRNAAADEAPFLPRNPSRFWRRLLNLTPLRARFGGFGPLKPKIHGDIGEFQFAKLHELADAPGPKYVFAHILLPHSPMVMDANGNRIARAEAGFSEEAKAPFVEQTRYTNTLVRRLVERLLQDTKRPPVILLQSEEGPYLRGRDWDLSPAERLCVRQGIFCALFVPGANAPVFDDDETAVNFYRKLLRHLFDAPIEPLPARIFNWEDRDQESEFLPRVLRFFEITDDVAPPLSQAAAGDEG